MTTNATPAGPSLTLVANPDRDRFELRDSERLLGLLAYDRVGDSYRLLHTVVEEEFGHMGIARLLVTLVLTRLRLDGATIEPVCSYVRRYLHRFPEYRDMVVTRPRA